MLFTVFCLTSTLIVESESKKNRRERFEIKRLGIVLEFGLPTDSDHEHRFFRFYIGIGVGKKLDPSLG